MVSPARIDPMIGTPEHLGWLNGVVKSILVLNLVDAVFTLWWVRAGFAHEANPLLRDLVEHHALLFVLGKLSLVGLGTLLLWRLRHRPIAVVGIFAMFLVYYGVVLYHLQFSGRLLGQLLDP